jgi:putative transposase
MRLIMDGIFYVVRSGCQWRLVPREFPPWQTD